MHRKRGYYNFCVRLAQDLALDIKEVSESETVKLNRLFFIIFYNMLRIGCFETALFTMVLY